MNEEVGDDSDHHPVAEVGAMRKLHAAGHVFVALLQRHADELQLALKRHPERWNERRQ